jgi:Xaa-Pro aminopeptidase
MEKLTKLRERFNEFGIDGMLVTSPSNRRYMTGFTGTAGTALISEQKAKFITDFRYVAQATNQARGYEIVENRDVVGEVAELASKMGITKLGFEQDHLSYKQFTDFNEKVQVELVPVSGVIEQLRTIKTEKEIKILKTAAEIADQAFNHILEYIRPGITEIDVNNELEFHMRKHGATSSSFDTIVASGYRSAMPHGVASNKVIEKGDMVTMDFGAYYEGYCSDITRTVAVGEPQEKMKEIYGIVHKALEKGTDTLKPGVSCKDVDSVVRDFITEAGYGAEFGHGTGHGVGLEIHEDPYFSQKSEGVLQSGHVMTVEPGIYLPGIGGVRIEDDALITDNGHEILTHSPTQLIIL